MKYKLEIDDVFEYLAHDYLTVDKVDYNGRRFFLANKLIDEETPGKEFVIFEALPEGLIVPNEDGADIKTVCDMFSQSMTKKIELINDEVVGK